MRKIYYQSVGNPLQLDRLPATRPETEMLPPAVASPSRLSELAVCLLIAAGAGLVTLILYRPPGLTWLEPYDLLLAGPTVAAGLDIWFVTGEVRWLLHPALLLAAVHLYVNHRFPWALQVVAVSGVTALLVYAFGRHWCAVCTASPTPRSTAEPLRTQWQRQLVVLAAIAGVLTGAMLWSGSVLLKLAVLTPSLAVIFVPRPQGLRSPRWRVVLESFVSWITYHAPPLPGLLQSPVGPAGHRSALTVFATVLAAVVLVRWQDSPIARLIEVAQTQHQSVTQRLNAQGAGTFEHLRYGGLTWGVTFIAIVCLPVVLPWAVAIPISMPVLLDAAAERDRATSTNNTQTALADLRRSPDLTERHSIYLGRVVEDGTPALVPRDVFREHAHGLGDSGSGKTSLFLCPLIEQLVSTGDCSVIVLDLKADSLELLAALQSAAEIARRQRGVRMPLRHFSNQAQMATFGFNPMTQPFWSKFDLRTRTDILCGANGLTYGTDYGQGFYSSANAAILYHALKTFPNVTTFTELADCIGNVITSARKRELNPEIRKAGVHVHEVMKRLAPCEPLNVTESGGYPQEVLQQAIDLTQVFQEPQLLYFHLSATLSPSGAPEIARLVNYMLLAAATQTERRHPVFLVIDEFQRMVASNLEYMLQLARSMGVGVILANQSMEDLKKPTTNLIPAIEANCRLRQWFSVSSTEDQQRLMKGSGLTIDRKLSRSVSTNSEGRQSVSLSQSEQVVDRVTLNDVLLTSDHPFRSFLRISRGDGYAQYGGMPVIIESSYHISEEEYLRRKSLPWPDGLEGSFVPKTAAQEPDTTSTAGPVVTTEVIGSSENVAESVASLFGSFLQSSSPQQTQRRRSPRRKSQ